MHIRQRPRASSLFLMELILAILFFSVTAAVCVRLFVKASQMAEQSSELSTAVNETCTAAELLCSAESKDEVFEQIQMVYPNAETNEEQIIFSDHLYADYTINDHLLSAELHYTADSEDIYSLSIKHALSDS